METYVLSKPIKYDGKDITEIIMDLDGLSAIDLERCEKEARRLLQKKEPMNVPETNKKYQACVAAKAADVPVDLIRSLGGKDYTQVCLLVMNFLLDGDSEDEETEGINSQATSGGTSNSTQRTETAKPHISTQSAKP